MVRRLLAGLTALAIVASGSSARAQTANAALPPGEGMEIVAVACSQCHGLNAITQLRENAEAWRFQVDDMILRGAQIAPGDIDRAVSYLASTFGPGVPFPGARPIEVDLPNGEAKPLVEGACTLCHGLDRVTAAKRSANGWKAIVRRMQFFGAPIDADQARDVADYLATRFGEND
jgi:cytochrome c5